MGLESWRRPGTIRLKGTMWLQETGNNEAVGVIYGDFEAGWDRRPRRLEWTGDQ